MTKYQFKNNFYIYDLTLFAKNNMHKVEKILNSNTKKELTEYFNKASDTISKLKEQKKQLKLRLKSIPPVLIKEVTVNREDFKKRKTYLKVKHAIQRQKNNLIKKQALFEIQKQEIQNKVNKNIVKEFLAILILCFTKNNFKLNFLVFNLMVRCFKSTKNGDFFALHKCFKRNSVLFLKQNMENFYKKVFDNKKNVSKLESEYKNCLQGFLDFLAYVSK